MLKEDTLVDNAAKEISLATIKILNNLENTKYRSEEIVLALASVSKELKNIPEKKETIQNLLKANNSGLIISGGVWFEPYMLDESKKDDSYFFNRTSNDQFIFVEDYMQESPIHYRNTEFYLTAKYLKEGETYWTKVYADPVTKIRMLTVVAPVYNHKKFMGVASLDIRIKEHSEKIFGTFKFPDRYLMMIDREGTFIVKSTLLSNYFNGNKLYDKDCNKFAKELEGIKSIFEKCTPSEDYNKTIAKALFKESPEIGGEESKRIAAILQKRNQSLKKDITENIKFIENDPILKEESIVATFNFPVTQWKVIIGIPKKQVLDVSNAIYQKIIDATIFLTLLATLIGYFLLKHLFIKPVEEINKQLQNNALQREDHYKLLKYHDKGEIGILVNNLNRRTIDLAASKEREADEIQKRIVNEKLLVQQAKMAEMGGMMDSVAHQWKQPLNAMSMYSDIIKMDFKEGEVDEAYINQFYDDIQLQINHMVTTLDEFRTFFRPNKEEEAFQLLDVINSVLFLTKDEFMKHSITFDILNKTPIEIYGHRNEFKHLIINIINNAKDAFGENQIKKRVISFSLIEDQEGERLEIRDNAGGIPDDVIGDIFKANVTTKVEGKGTGIGLFMSMQIAKKNGADLSVHNEKDGACFIVRFNPSDVVEL